MRNDLKKDKNKDSVCCPDMVFERSLQQIEPCVDEEVSTECLDLLQGIFTGTKGVFDHQHHYCKKSECQLRNERGSTRHSKILFIAGMVHTFTRKRIRHFCDEVTTSERIDGSSVSRIPSVGNRLKILFCTRLQQSYGVGTVYGEHPAYGTSGVTRCCGGLPSSGYVRR